MLDEADFFSFLTIVQGLSNWSLKGYASQLRIFKRWLGTREWTRPLIEQFLFELKQSGKYKPGSINRFFFFFSQIEQYRKDRNLSPLGLKFKTLPTFQEPISILTPSEIEKIINHKIIRSRRNNGLNRVNDEVYREFTMALAFTGARIDEMTSLKAKYVSLSDSVGKLTFVKTKNNVVRSVYIQGRLLEIFRRIIEGKSGEDLVFMNTRGNPIHKGDYASNLKLRCQQAGITKRVHPHLFRHSYGTQLIEEGVPIEQLQVILGHRDISSTQTYIHMADKTIEKAMFKHPSIRRDIDPREILKNAIEVIKNLRFDTDDRFSYKLEEGSQSVSLLVFVK